MAFFVSLHCVVSAASGYAPAQRGLSWLKLKRDYLEGLADSLDLVPIGAWWGQGRKVRKGSTVMWHVGLKTVTP